MNVYLDDVRPTPPGWVRVSWPDEAIRLLETGAVTCLSLDYDLGDAARGTGEDVLAWLHAAVVMRQFVPPEILIHTGSDAARERMLLAVANLQRLAQRPS